MRRLALALALFIAPAVVVAQDKPAAPAPAPKFELPFSAQPAGIPSVADFTGPQAEGAPTNGDVPGSLAAGDLVIKWLVAHKVCDPKGPTCTFTLHFQVLQDKPVDEEVTHYVQRYALRGENGTVVEGFALAAKDDESNYRFWHKTPTGWTELTTDEDKVAESAFLADLTALANILVRAGYLHISR